MLTIDNIFPPQLSNEPDSAYATFKQYCHLGPDRLLTKLQSVKGINSASHTTLSKWKNKYDWDRRVKDYDGAIAMIAEDAIKSKVSDEVLKYYSSFRICFQSTHAVHLEILRKTLAIATMSDEDMGKKIKTITALKGLAQIMASLSQSMKNNHDAWGNLLGIEQIKEKMDSMGELN